MNDDRERTRTRWRMGWPAVGTMVGIVGLLSLATGFVAGHDAEVTQAAVDRKMLIDNDAKVEALSERMGEHLATDAVQDSRLKLLEQQHSELMARLNSLLDIMWKDEIRREGRR